MGRKKPRMGTIVGILAVVAILALVFGVYSGALSGVGITTGTATERTTTFSAANCPDDYITTINTKVEDDGAATETFISGVKIHAKNVDSGVIENDTTSSSTAWMPSDVTCGKNYKIYGVTQNATSGSAESDVIQADEDKEYVKLHTNQLSKMTIKYKDVVGDDWETLIADNNKTGNGNATTGVDLNRTLIYESGSATAAFADISVGTDGYLDGYFEIKSATNRKSANDQGKKGELNPSRLDLKNYFCVDLNGATNGQEWDSDSLKVSLSDGVALPNVYSSIDAKSKEYVDLQKAEACYDIGDVNDIFKRINFYVKAKSGENPDATDDDINILIYSEGTYLSALNSDEIKVGIFNDKSTQQGVVFTINSEEPKAIFQIS